MSGGLNASAARMAGFISGLFAAIPTAKISHSPDSATHNRFSTPQFYPRNSTMKIPLLAILFSTLAFSQVPALQSAVPLPTPRSQFLTQNGTPCAGCYLWTYAAGTSTLQATYTDSTAGTPNTNPVVLDAGGSANIWIGGQSYKLVLESPPFVGGHGSVAWTVDNVTDTTFFYLTYLRSISDSALLTYISPGASAVSRTVRAKLTELGINVVDYGAKCDGLTDDTAAITAALTYAPTGGVVYFPTGTCKATQIVIDKAITLHLDNTALVLSGDPGIDIMVSGVSLSGISRSSSSISNITSAANTIRIGANLSDVQISSLSLAAANNVAAEPARETGNVVFIRGTTSSPLLTCPTRTNRVTISENYITGGNNGVLAQCAQNVIITNNHFNNAHGGLAQASLHSTNTSTIANNNFTDSGHSANAVYILHLTGYESTGNVVAANTASGTYDYEVVNVFGKGNVVSANTLTSTSTTAGKAQAGIRVTQPVDTSASTSGNVVDNNRITLADSPTGVGIQVNDNGSSGAFGSNDNIISNNVIYAPIGVIVSANCKRVSVTGNRIYQTGYTCANCDGISLQGATNLQVTGNYVTGSTRYGIFDNSSSIADISGNQVISTNQGIACDGAATRVKIMNNIVTGVTNTGISAGNCTLVQFFSNLSYSNGTNISYGTATFDGTVLDRLLLNNNQGIGAKLAAGTSGLDILYRDPSDNVILRNSETLGLVTFRVNGDVNRLSVLPDGQIRLYGSDGARNHRIIAASGAPLGACSNGSIYLRDDGGAGTTFYVCELGAWVGK